MSRDQFGVRSLVRANTRKRERAVAGSNDGRSKVRQSVMPNSMMQKPLRPCRTPSTVWLRGPLCQSRCGVIIAKTLTTCCAMTNFISHLRRTESRSDVARGYNRYRLGGPSERPAEFISREFTTRSRGIEEKLGRRRRPSMSAPERRANVHTVRYNFQKPSDSKFDRVKLMSLSPTSNWMRLHSWSALVLRFTLVRWSKNSRGAAFRSEINS